MPSAGSFGSGRDTRSAFVLAAPRLDPTADEAEPLQTPQAGCIGVELWGKLTRIDEHVAVLIELQAHWASLH